MVEGSDVELEVTHMLHARGERMTGPRRAVVHALASHPGHVLAEQVVRTVAEQDPSVHRASVYRTLEALIRLRVVQHVHVGHGGTAYHLLRSEGSHLHASCGGCGAVLDLPADLLSALAARLPDDHDFVLDPTHVALSGRCGNCRDSAPGTALDQP